MEFFLERSDKLSRIIFAIYIYSIYNVNDETKYACIMQRAKFVQYYWILIYIYI